MTERVTRPCYHCGLPETVTCPGPSAPDADCARAIPEDEWLCDSCFAMREEAQRDDEERCHTCGDIACEGECWEEQERCDCGDDGEGECWEEQERCDCGDEFCEGECEL